MALSPVVLLPLAACVGDDPVYDTPSSSSGATTSSSSGEPTSSSSSSGATNDPDASADANIELDADTGTCAPALAPPPLSDAGCGESPLDADAITYGPLTTSHFTGGTIPTGIYEAVRAEAHGITGTLQAVWVFRANGEMSRSTSRTSASAAVQQTGKGTWSTAGSTLKMDFTCRNGAQPLSEDYSFAVRNEGCDVFVDVGVTGERITLRKRTE